METISREMAQELVKQYGGRITSAVSKKTSYLVVGREPGMSKIGKAKICGTPTLDEDGWYEFMAQFKPKESSVNNVEEKKLGKCPVY